MMENKENMVVKSNFEYLDNEPDYDLHDDDDYGWELLTGGNMTEEEFWTTV